MALAAANGQKLTPEQIALIARPDVQQQKLIEETRKAKRQSVGGGMAGGMDGLKKLLLEETNKWGAGAENLSKFWEDGVKLPGVAANTAAGTSSAASVNGEKKKMEGFGSSPPPSTTKESPRLSAILWKRRSGLGKHSTINPWEKRRVELIGSTLLYYETPEEAQGEELSSQQQHSGSSPVPTTPKRSIFEQAAQNAEQTIQKTREEFSRMAQTVVGLESLKYTSNSSPTIPRGCLDILKEQASISASFGHSLSPTPFCLSVKVKSETKWKFCMESYSMLMEWLVVLNDVVIRSSVDIANEEGGHHWDVQEYSLNFGNAAAAAAKSHGQDLSPDIMSRSTSRQWTNRSDTGTRMKSGSSDASLTQLHLKIIIAISNFVIILSRSSMLSIERWWSLFVFFNFGMYQFFKFTIRSSPAMNNAKKPTDASISLRTSTKQSRSNALAGSSCIQVKHIGDSNITDSGNKLPTWIPIPSCDMEVRSRGYLTTKKKIASPGELYECIAVDCFQSENRCSEMALRVVLPKVEFNDGGVKRWKSPDIFVVGACLRMHTTAYISIFFPKF